MCVYQAVRPNQVKQTTKEQNKTKHRERESMNMEENNNNRQLPIDGDGACMVCKSKVGAEAERLHCKTCVTPWHTICLASPPKDLASCLQWECPDCTDLHSPQPFSLPASSSSNLVAAIRAIEGDDSLTDKEKAEKRQELLGGKANVDDDGRDTNQDDVLRVFDDSLNCSFCMQLPDRPVTTPCGHNFCLKCFEKWIGQGKRTCAKCRQPIPSKMASQPRINSSLVYAIRIAKLKRSSASGGPPKVYHQVHNQDRPDKAYTTDRAKKTGKANAASGKIFVTIPSDFFGPITAEYDPTRNQGVLVGESWEDRLECRQWGAHFPHVAGIAGQSGYGAQSVALSGGYLDDEDHGEWFLYTGSGGRDLSGNKRTNKDQSFDQVFDKSNEALRLSCLKGYPIRVVRSHKEKRSNYAPEKGVRYDGIYRIEKCWRKVGIQGFKVCRYLFVRCDNEPAPWTSDERGDQPRPLPDIPELNNATDITERKKSPSWGFDENDGCWKWNKPPPASLKGLPAGDVGDAKRTKRATKKAQNLSVREKLLKGFGCLICQKVMNFPVTTPCGHNFCKSCLEGAFPDKAILTDRSRGGRTLRARKNVYKCPSCPADISDFLQDPKVNSDLKGLIESLKSKIENGDANEEGSEDGDVGKDGEDETLENHDEGPKDSSEKANANDLNGATDSCKVETGEDSSENLEVRIANPSLKLKRARDDAFSSQLGEGKGRKSRKVQEAADGREESPSSPLHVESGDSLE